MGILAKLLIGTAILGGVVVAGGYFIENAKLVPP